MSAGRLRVKKAKEGVCKSLDERVGDLEKNNQSVKDGVCTRDQSEM